jgi:putative peptidoglycan lipid II flippase
LAAEADERLRLELTRRWAKRFFWLGALGAAALMWVAEPAVALLFERGNFTRADTAQTSALLRLMALQWPLYLVGTVWVQWALARGGRLSGLLWAALAGTGAKLAVSLLLVAWLGWGAEAICVGLAAATVGYWLALKASVWRCIVKVGG